MQSCGSLLKAHSAAHSSVKGNSGIVVVVRDRHSDRLFGILLPYYFESFLSHHLYYEHHLAHCPGHILLSRSRPTHVSQNLDFAHPLSRALCHYHLCCYPLADFHMFAGYRSRLLEEVEEVEEET